LGIKKKSGGKRSGELEVLRKDRNQMFSHTFLNPQNYTGWCIVVMEVPRVKIA